MPQRIFGRTNVSVPFIWSAIGDRAVGTQSWCAMEIGPDALDRRADKIVIDQLAAVGRSRCDLLIVQDLLSSDLKVGWPTHRLMQMRDRGLCDWFAIEVDAPLEAEWIAGNAPIHAIVAPYTADDMSIRYRAMDAAHNAGVAIISRAHSTDDLCLHFSTPQICATIPSNVIDINQPIPPLDVDSLWDLYQQSHDPPPKLRSGHPPD